MSEPGVFDSHHETWPPRQGKVFFLLWIGGALAGWIASSIIAASIGFSAALGARLDAQWVYALPGIAVALFQGWLLFPRGFRLCAWTALPMFRAAIPYVSTGTTQAAAMSLVFGLASLSTAIVSTLLLIGVRRRPWLWLFIQLGTVVLNQLFMVLLFTTFGLQDLDAMAAKVNALLGLKGPLAISGSALVASASSTLWLGSTILAAAALAWWMPPQGTPPKAPPIR